MLLGWVISRCQKKRVGYIPTRPVHRAGMGGFEPKMVIRPKPRLLQSGPNPPIFGYRLERVRFFDSRVRQVGFNGLGEPKINSVCEKKETQPEEKKEENSHGACYEEEED